VVGSHADLAALATAPRVAGTRAKAVAFPAMHFIESHKAASVASDREAGKKRHLRDHSAQAKAGLFT